MSRGNITASADTDRCFGRLKAQELTQDEVESVSGGTSYTAISLDHYDSNGDPVYAYGDSDPFGP